MSAVDLPPPAQFPGALVYEHADIPPGLTVTQWRWARAEQHRHERTARRAARRRSVIALLTLGAARRRARPPAAAASSRAVTS